jgi:hypothetical protein
MWKLGLGILAVVVCMILFFIRKSKQHRPIIYGNMGCPHTVHHRQKYPDATFVDCATEKCPDFVTAYPTTKWPDGNITMGSS